jgi:hypothetical protein
MVEIGNIHCGQGRNRTRQGASRSFRHVNLDIELVRVQIITQVGLATGGDLNSRNPLSGILSSGIESTSCVLSFVKLPVADLDDVGNND